MATTRIKEKISQLVRSQLPEFIQADYETFVVFIEAYYRFLEQDQGAFELIQNSRAYGDIDQTTEAFVKYFLKNYAPDIPTNVLANKKLVVKKIKDLYESKGSELSFDLLFRFLFNKTATINYPYDFVLRASDGRWSQKVSLRIETISGNRDIIANRLLRYTSSNGFIYETPILETKNLSSTITEVFLDPNLIAPSYTLGDTVVVPSSNGNVFAGTIVPTTTGYAVTQAGSGFRLGQVYTVNYEGGVSSLFQITALTSGGGISELKFIGFGYGFPTDIGTTFTAVFDPSKTVSEISEGISSSTQGFGSRGSILLDDVTSPDRYFDSNYVEPFYTFTSLASSFDTGTYSPASVGDVAPPSNFAIITMRLGAISRYPGLFTAPNGFLSEPDVRLEDALLYQPFAYQTNTELDVNDFYDIVRNLIHPAGQRLFNNRLISGTIDLSANLVLSPTSNVFTELLDVFDVLDVQTYNFNKVLEDVQTVSEDSSINITKEFDETLNILETPSITFTLQTINDSVSMSDDETVGYFVTRTFIEQRSNDYFLETYADDYAQVTGFVMLDASSVSLDSGLTDVSSISDAPTIQLQLPTIVDALTMSEQALLSSNVVFADTQTISEQISIELQLGINNQTTISESISGLIPNYAEAGYFANIYAGETVI